jgi:NADH:ubiquinone oxidoreductase subunit 6 (subunit J)
VLESRLDALAVLSSIAIAGLLFAMVRPLADTFAVATASSGPSALSQALLGRLLPQFEAVGVLLLVSLVAVVVIVGGDRE